MLYMFTLIPFSVLYVYDINRYFDPYYTLTFKTFDLQFHYNLLGAGWCRKST